MTASCLAPNDNSFPEMLNIIYSKEEMSHHGEILLGRKTEGRITNNYKCIKKNDWLLSLPRKSV